MPAIELLRKQNRQARPTFRGSLVLEAVSGKLEADAIEPDQRFAFSGCQPGAVCVAGHAQVISAADIGSKLDLMIPMGMYPVVHELILMLHFCQRAVAMTF